MRKIETNDYFWSNSFMHETYKLQKKFPKKMSKEEMYDIIINAKEIEPNLESIKRYEALDDSINYSKLTPLLIEILLGDVHSVRDLISKKYDYTEKYDGGINPAMFANYIRDFKIANYLYAIHSSFGKDKTKDDVDLLKVACQMSNSIQVDELIKDYPNSINELDKKGNNPLFYVNRDLFTMKSLDVNMNLLKKIEPGAFVNDHMHDLDIIRCLIKNGIDVNHQVEGSTYLETILKDSIVYKFPNHYTNKVVKLLVDAGSDKTIRRTGKTDYEYFGGFSNIRSDVAECDFSFILDLPNEYLEYAEFKKVIKDNGLTIYDQVSPSHSDSEKSFVMTYKDGKKIK